jgi:hypothetical protein
MIRSCDCAYVLLKEYHHILEMKSLVNPLRSKDPAFDLPVQDSSQNGKIFGASKMSLWALQRLNHLSRSDYTCGMLYHMDQHLSWSEMTNIDVCRRTITRSPLIDN